MQNNVGSEKAPEGAECNQMVVDDNYMRLLGTFANIFKKATGRTIAMTPADDCGRHCIAWIASDDDLPGEFGGIEPLSLGGE